MNYGVITACLNSSTTILRTIHSILSQEILPREYIFVDGGSTDGTLALIEKEISRFSEKHPEIHCRVVHQTTKGGIYEAWNIGLEHFTSEIVFILNSDDWYPPDTAAYVLRLFEKKSHADIVLGAGKYLKGVDDPRPEICHIRPRAVIPFAMTLIHPACFVKKAVYDRLGGFDTRYKVAGDYEFVYRCYQARLKIVKTRKILTNILRGGFAESNQILARQEVYEIGRRYAISGIFPLFAYWCRILLLGP